MDGKCASIGENRNICRRLVGQPEKIDHLEDIGAYGR